MIFRVYLQMPNSLGAFNVKRKNTHRIHNTPVLALVEDSLAKFGIKIAEATTAILLLTLTLRVVVELALPRVSIVSVLLLAFKLAFDQVHIKACVLQLVFP